MDRIFHRGWVFVGHDTEIPRPGDFVTRRIGTQPTLMVRGTDARISVFMNLTTRVKLLQTGYRFSQLPPSPMRRLISNVEVTRAESGELVAESNFILVELSIQAKHETHLWAGRTTHRLRRVDGELRMSAKKVVLVNAAEPLPNLSFLI
jgi:hypothetical protein